MSDPSSPYVDYMETEELRAIRESVNALCKSFPLDYWQDLDSKKAYPSEFVSALTEAGYLGVLIPEEYGGSGLGLVHAVTVLEEIHRSGCNGGACHAQMYTMGALLRHGTTEQKKRWLPHIASGETRLQAFAVTEPTTGTNTLNLKTQAIRCGDHYIVNGQKVFISRAEHSDLMLLLARTTPIDQVKKKSEGLSLFVVNMHEAQKSGLTIQPIDTMLNHHTTELFFDNVAVPVANRIGEEGKGFRCILDGMNAERVLCGAEALGDAHWFTQTSVNYANERVVFDRPIGKNQGVQFPIARAYAQTQAARQMIYKAAYAFDAGQPMGEAANIAKMLASEAAWAAADTCMQTHGGFGYAEEYHVERKFREARVYQTAPISTNMILCYLAEHVLGLPRSY